MLITKCNSAAKNERAQISAKPSCMGVIIEMFPKLLQLQGKKKTQQTNPKKQIKETQLKLWFSTKERGIKADGAVAHQVWPVECPVCSRWWEMELSTGAVGLQAGWTPWVNLCVRTGQKGFWYFTKFSSAPQSHWAGYQHWRKRLRVQVGCQTNGSWPRPWHHLPLGAFLTFLAQGGCGKGPSSLNPQPWINSAPASSCHGSLSPHIARYWCY